MVVVVVVVVAVAAATAVAGEEGGAPIPAGLPLAGLFLVHRPAARAAARRRPPQVARDGQGLEGARPGASQPVQHRRLEVLERLGGGIGWESDLASGLGEAGGGWFRVWGGGRAPRKGPRCGDMRVATCPVALSEAH